MIRLYAIQAKNGDCFLVEYGEYTSEYILIDGGPSGNYKAHLEPALKHLLKSSQNLESIIISHVDNDHIMGVLELIVKLKFQRDNGKNEFLNIGQFWFNSFNKTIGSSGMETRINNINIFAGNNSIQMLEMGLTFNSISRGTKLAADVASLKIPINPDAEKGFYAVRHIAPAFKKSNLEITIVGPTLKNLKKIQKTWEDWIKTNEQKIQNGQYTKEFAAMSDQSIPNMSSIILLIKADGRSILLTGDCRGDHLQKGLIETKLSVKGSYHVDILKVPHHGSHRNVTKKFFKEITADTYVISADGTNGNPDIETLSWIVETAKEAGRKIQIVFTNVTNSTTELLQVYPPSDWGYEVKFIPVGEHFLQIIIPS